MSDIPQSESRPQRRTVAVESLSVSPKVAGQMLDYGKTKVAELIKNQELESYVALAGPPSSAVAVAVAFADPMILLQNGPQGPDKLPPVA